MKFYTSQSDSYVNKISGELAFRPKVTCQLQRANPIIFVIQRSAALRNLGSRYIAATKLVARHLQVYMIFSVFYSCSDAVATFDKGRASSLSKAEILEILQVEQPAITAGDVCLSNRIIWPSYMGFSDLINCDSIDYIGIVDEISTGFNCEDQYIYNLQHQYDDPWEKGVGKFTFLKDIDSDSCLYTIFFSDFQNKHVYAALVNNRQLIESDGPMLLFGHAKEFMIKFSNTGEKVDWIKTTEIVDSSFLLPPQ